MISPLSCEPFQIPMFPAGLGASFRAVPSLPEQTGTPQPFPGVKNGNGQCFPPQENAESFMIELPVTGRTGVVERLLLLIMIILSRFVPAQPV